MSKFLDILKLINEEQQDIKSYFIKKIKNHIRLVQDYARLIEQEFPEAKGLSQIAKSHDASKLVEPSLTPYSHITWRDREKHKGRQYIIPDDIDDTAAVEHHVKTNKHHPEYWTDQINTIHPENRHKIQKLIDATKMSDMAIFEMCADWMAVSEEVNSNPKDWGRKNINLRWKFSKRQEQLIYNVFNKIW